MMDNISYRDSNWLSSQQLHTIMGKKARFIIHKLESVQSSMPQYVQYKAAPGGGRTVICLHKDHVDEFIQVADIPDKKDANWLSIAELRSILHTSYYNIKTELQRLQSVMPDSIQYKSNDIRRTLCLRKQDLDKFIQYAKFPKKQEKNWITSEQVSALIKKNSYVVKFKLKELLLQNPEWIQYKHIKSKKIICLHKDYLDTFYNMAGFNAIKDDNWLNVVDLTSITHKSFYVIKKLLTQLQSDTSYHIEYRLQGTQFMLCLHKDCIEKFQKALELNNKAKHSSRVIKHTQWLTIADLCIYFHKSYYVIKDALIKIQPMMSKEEIDYKIPSKQRILCLNKNSINKFCNLTGFSR